MFISSELASIFMYLMASWIQNINSNFEDCTHCGFYKTWYPDDNLFSVQFSIPIYLCCILISLCIWLLVEWQWIRYWAFYTVTRKCKFVFSFFVLCTQEWGDAILLVEFLILMWMRILCKLQYQNHSSESSLKKYFWSSLSKVVLCHIGVLW